MEQETSLLSTVKSLVAYALLFLFPLFFLPFTQEYFITAKIYLLFFGGLLLLLISTLEFLVTKKMVWRKGQFDNTMILFFVTAVLSTIIASPNKVQAALQPVFGVMPLFAFVVLYFYLSRKTNETLKNGIVFVSGILVSVVSVFYFFNPLKNASLPDALAYLKSPYFTPMGSQLDAVYFLGFVAAMALAAIFAKNAKSKNQAVPLVALVTSLAAVALTLFSFFKAKNGLVLPPFNLSWYGAVETLKQPVTALFGVGIDNYSAMFTHVKDMSYNSSALWQIPSFNVARSTVLHVLTEMGAFGVAAFVLLLLQITKKALELKSNGNFWSMLPLLYVIVMVLLFPPSITMVFLVLLAAIGVGVHEKHVVDSHAAVFDTGKILPLYATMLVLAFLFIGASGYFVGRTYAAELYFNKSLEAYAGNNAKSVYENMRQAIILNPYIERFHGNFAQVNLMIANNIASKLTQQPKEGQKAPQLTDEEKQTVSQALQAAIEEAKATVTLNPQKAANWDTLASIYRNIINVAQGADTWTVSAYQRAIVLDPQNPMYRVNLGGVMFALKNYDQALSLFEQAVSIKPDWANAHYNLAWAAYQKEDYKTAATAMQNAVSLLDPKNDPQDYQRATAELVEFKKKLPAEDAASASAKQKEPSQLSMPTPPVQKPLQEQIKLPKTASPEAK